MKNRWCCSQPRRARRIRRQVGILLIGLGVAARAPSARAGDAPQWMHSRASSPLPAFEDKTDAVLLYSETTVSVQSPDKIKRTVREAYKILRPAGREYGYVVVPFNSHQKVNNLHGWCIPAQGKDYEVNDKSAMVAALPTVEGSELISDVKAKIIHIPAAEPGNVIGYEYQVDEQPLVLQDTWRFQERTPVQESHYTLQLPAGWEYRATWLNFAEAKPTASTGQTQWTVFEVKAVRPENEMPPLAGVAGQMVVSFFPSSGSVINGFSNWQEMGTWYDNLTLGRADPSPEIKQKVAELTASVSSPIEKMRAIASFVQHDIRYVAIELGIGGWQPHPAADVFRNRYGDCKDKATLLGSMLHEIGVESYYVSINTKRGAVTSATPAHLGFNHLILAIKIPENLNDSRLIATMHDAKLGKILFFDPTNEYTPLGQIGGYLQANYGLLISPQGGELLELPTQPGTTNGILRTGKLILDPSGRLTGSVSELRMGDRAADQRRALRNVTKSEDRIKPIESLLAASLPSFRITKASVTNLTLADQPFGFDYAFEAENYAKNAGNLLLLRPRVVGTKTQGTLETKDPRVFPIEFDGPARDMDNFEIALPAGYEVEELPPPVDAEYSFASYHAKTEVQGNVVDYRRTFEVKELSVPAARAEELKRFYRIVATDERNTIVLRPTGK